MTGYEVLINDNMVAPATAIELLRRGYFAVPCGAGDDGKGWINAAGNQTSITKPAQDGAPPDADVVMSVFDSHPGCGVSVALPFMRGRDDLLIGLDVDVRDPATLEKVALVIGRPCPVKVGDRGATFFVRMANKIEVDVVLSARGLPIPRFADPQGKQKRMVQSGKIGSERWHGEYIDVLGVSNRHSILPPSLHLLASRASGSEVRYRWVEFPGSRITQRLQDVEPDALPVVGEAQLLLLFQWAKNPDSPIWKFIGQTSPGDFHEVMLQAALYMWHEKFTADEITRACEIEAFRSATDDGHYRRRRTDIHNAVRDLEAKFPEQKPAGVKQPKAAKVPLDRLAMEWLHTTMPPDDVGIFGSTGYRWLDGGWQRLTDPWHPRTPAGFVRDLIMAEFPTAGLGVIVSAADRFLDKLIRRQPQPDPLAIPFANGVLDIRTMQLRPEVRDDFIIGRIPFNYDPAARCPTYDIFVRDLMTPPLEHAGSPNYEADGIRAVETLEEFIGLTLVMTHEYRTMVGLIGKTSTGKSELIKLIRAIYPEEWISAVDIQDFDDPNSMAAMVTAHLNVSAEVGRHSKDVDANLLKVTSGEQVPLKLLYRDKWNGVVGARLLFHGNIMPSTTDSTGAMERRMILLKTTDVQPERRIPDYHKVLAREAPGIVNRWVAAYARLVARGWFDPPQYSIESNRQATIDANSVSTWLSEMCEPVERDADGLNNRDLFQHYADFCTDGRLFCYSVTQWGKILTGAGYPNKSRRGPGGKFHNYRRLKLVNDFQAARY